MFKYLLFFAISMFMAAGARCQNRDTAFFYYKNTAAQPKLVSTLDSADFIRMYYPPDSGETLYNVKEFYKNGKIKFIGKFDLDATKSYQSDVQLMGDCISFYLNGEKQSISHYVNGKKDGLEYFFRLNGHISYTKKWIDQGYGMKPMQLYWDCYNDAGNMICNNGNGKWMLYDAQFKNVILSGQVVKGYMDGAWQGATMQDDSIKYICNFKRGAFESAFGYDSAHNAYPFTSVRQPALYIKNSSLIDFLEDLNKHLKLPKDANGKKADIDTVHIAFVIDKDGHLTQFEVVGGVSTQLKDALNIAVVKCGNWEPSKYFGIPFVSKIVIPLKIHVDEEKGFTIRSIQVKGPVVDFLAPDLDLAAYINQFFIN